MRVYKLSFIMLSATLMSCSEHEIGPGIHNDVGVAVAPSSIPGNSVGKAGPTTDVSGGPNPVGVISPTGVGVVARIENGLSGNAKSTRGNFAKALAQVGPNLPKVTAVTDASGYDQVELLAYAACSDLTIGTQPLMQTQYGVSVAGTISDNQSALVNAGLKILDQHTAGLASQGPASAQVQTILTSLVQTEAGVSSNTTTIAFVAVCIAANTAGATMLGF